MTTSERSLATILFTDIIGSTERATELGDRKWRELLEEHHARVRRELRRFGGRELNISGDGFLAVFEGPARAIACADALRQAMMAVGQQHTPDGVLTHCARGVQTKNLHAGWLPGGSGRVGRVRRSVTSQNYEARAGKNTSGGPTSRG